MAEKYKRLMGGYKTFLWGKQKRSGVIWLLLWKLLRIYFHAKEVTSFPGMRLLTGMWLIMATTGKPNAYLTIYINSSDTILKID